MLVTVNSPTSKSPRQNAILSYLRFATPLTFSGDLFLWETIATTQTISAVFRGQVSQKDENRNYQSSLNILITYQLSNIDMQTDCLVNMSGQPGSIGMQ